MIRPCQIEASQVTAQGEQTRSTGIVSGIFKGDNAGRQWLCPASWRFNVVRWAKCMSFIWYHLSSFARTH